MDTRVKDGPKAPQPENLSAKQTSPVKCIIDGPKAPNPGELSADQSGPEIHSVEDSLPENFYQIDISTVIPNRQVESTMNQKNKEVVQ